MPATRSVSRESHGHYIQNARTAEGARTWRWCRHVANPLAPVFGEPYATATGSARYGHRPRLAPDPQRYVARAAELEADATALGLTVDDLLCLGCRRRKARLVVEGLWPA